MLEPARQKRFDRKRRRFHDLGEDAQVVLGEIRRPAAVAEVLRQVDDLVRPALERHAKVLPEMVEVHARAPRHDDARRVQRPLEPVLDERFRHQRRDLDADVGDAPRAVREPEPADGRGKARLGQMAGYEEELFGRICHGRARIPIILETFLAA